MIAVWSWTRSFDQETPIKPPQIIESINSDGKCELINSDGEIGIGFDHLEIGIGF